MVMKNERTPPSSTKEQVFNSLFGSLLNGLSAEFGPKDTLPKDDPAYMAKYASSAEQCARQLESQKACPCPRCKLSMFETAISKYVCEQTVAAAITGDTSKLQAVLDLIEGRKQESE